MQRTSGNCPCVTYSNMGNSPRWEMRRVQAKTLQGWMTWHMFLTFYIAKTVISISEKSAQWLVPPKRHSAIYIKHIMLILSWPFPLFWGYMWRQKWSGGKWLFLILLLNKYVLLLSHVAVIFMFCFMFLSVFKELRWVCDCIVTLFKRTIINQYNNIFLIKLCCFLKILHLLCHPALPGLGGWQRKVQVEKWQHLCAGVKGTIEKQWLNCSSAMWKCFACDKDFLEMQSPLRVENSNKKR